MIRRLATAAVLGAVGLAGIVATPPADGASTGLSAKHSDRIVSRDPASTTPNILDGTVTSIAQVGSQIVVGGTFTQVQNPGSSTVLTRNRVFAFDAATGLVSTTFNPNPNGTVYKVQAATDGTSVYLGGKFTSVAGATVNNLTRVKVSSGARVTAFAPPKLTGEVRDLEVLGSRLWVAGKFTHVGGKAQKALATLNAGTGAYDGYFTGKLAGLHNPDLAGSVTSVLQIASNAANTQLVAVGNFTTVDGASRSQIAKIKTSGSTYALSSWTTKLFTSACSPKFESYVTDVSYSPDGSYFVASTTGAFGGSTPSMAGTSGCDVVARFSSSTSGLAKPAWTAYTGGDTTWSVEVTDDVVYVGGHQRYQNNPTGNNAVGEGAVARTGIAALDPVNGLPYSWNPTRSRGVGVKDMLATSQGLYVGSDTTTIGGEYHARLALLPLSGGDTLTGARSYPIPADVYTVASGGSQLVKRGFSGTGVTSTANAPAGPGWSTAVGAFMVNGVLYQATSDGVVTRRTFDGSSYGPASTVDTADALVRQARWHDTEVPTLTSLFYAKGRIYFTRSGSNVLYDRAFAVEDDVVGQQVFSSGAPSGISYSSTRGAFVAGGKFYYATSTGQLFRADWSGTAPVGGTAVQVSGPGKDSQKWASRAMFVHQS